MADNTRLNPGIGGDDIATLDVAGVKHEKVIVEYLDGGGNPVMVDASNPLPVLASIDTTGLATSANQLTEIAALASIAAEDFATETTLSDIDTKLGSPLPLPTGAATAANQQTDALTNTQLRAVPVPVSGTISTGLSQPLTDTQLRATPVPVSGTVTTGGLTDTQLRATPVPVSGTVTVNTSTLATSAKQDDIISLLATIDSGIPATLGQKPMATSMPVTISSDQSAVAISGTVSISGATTDNTLLYNDSLSVSGATEAIITTGYQSICIQVYDPWVGNITIEGSNGDIEYVPIQVLNIEEISSSGSIYANGNYIFKVSSRFIRINVVQISGTASILMIGRTTIGMSSSDFLSMAMDRANGTPLYIEETASKKDQSNALVPSDAIIVTGTIGKAINDVSKVIDTQGYQSMTVQFTGMAGVPNMAFQESNDQGTWTVVPFKPITGAVEAVATNVNATYSVPCRSRFMRITNQSGNTNVTFFTAALRIGPIVTGTANTNITQIAGTATVNGGTAGTLSVGGNVANAGTASGQNPILIGGADPSGLLRRLATDTSGRLINSITDQSGTGRAIGGFSPSSNAFNVSSQAVQDVGSFEGQTIYDLLGQLLLEMKINNQYLYDLPIALQRVLNDTNKNVGGFGSEPQDFRNDPTMFAA